MLKLGCPTYKYTVTTMKVKVGSVYKESCYFANSRCTEIMSCCKLKQNEAHSIICGSTLFSFRGFRSWGINRHQKKTNLYFLSLLWTTVGRQTTWKVYLKGTCWIQPLQVRKNLSSGILEGLGAITIDGSLLLGVQHRNILIKLFQCKHSFSNLDFIPNHHVNY